MWLLFYPRFPAGREAPPYGLCHENAVVLRPTGPDSRGRLSLRFGPR